MNAANDDVRENLKNVLADIAERAVAAGRDPATVRLVAVSKTKPVELIQQAYDAGQRVFGENRVQELEEKHPLLPADVEWHLIGHLQSNKAVKAVRTASCVHSVDSAKLVSRLDRLACENAAEIKILFEVNVSGEDGKYGLSPTGDGLLKAVEEAGEAKNLVPVGLMTMAPFGVEDDELRRVFAGLREIRDRLENRLGAALPELSMGMSSDYGVAIQEGATMVRIGTAVFGSRS